MMAGSSIAVSVDGDDLLDGDLIVPAEPVGVVVFAHGSGSGRASPRNRFVAERLQRAGLATVLVDLLTAEEAALDDRSAQFRFDVDLLARRLEQVVDWTGHRGSVATLPLGLFGASTGAAAALVAAAHRGRVGAVVSRGGRPDLAGGELGAVTVPTLLVVGSLDVSVIELNRAAAHHLSAPCRLEIVEGATHLFEEPGTLARVADLSVEWFTRHLGDGGGATDG
jgi:putative phosphoribosyl transferase